MMYQKFTLTVGLNLVELPESEKGRSTLGIIGNENVLALLAGCCLPKQASAVGSLGGSGRKIIEGGSGVLRSPSDFRNKSRRRICGKNGTGKRRKDVKR